MTKAEFFTRCVPICEKVGWPEWEGQRTKSRFKLCAPTDDHKYWSVRQPWTTCGVTAWFFDHDITDHEAAGIIKDWLEKEFAARDIYVSRFLGIWVIKHEIGVGRVDEVLREDFTFGYATLRNEALMYTDKFTALVEAADKVLARRRG